MKKQGNSEVAKRIDELKSKLYVEGDVFQFNEEADRELSIIEKEYDLFDIVFEENGKKGIKDIAGRIRVPALYKDYSAVYFYTWGREYPVAAMNESNKFALVDANGTGMPFCEFLYDSINYMFATNGFFICAKIDGESVMRGVLNAKGEVLVPCEMDAICEMANNLIVLEKGGKYGFLTYDGVFGKPIYDDIEDELGLLRVCKNGVWGVVNVDCDFIAEDDEERMENEELLVLYSF